MHTRWIVVAATAMALTGLAPPAHAAPNADPPKTVTAKECTDGGGTVQTDKGDFSKYCQGGKHNGVEVQF